MLMENMKPGKPLELFVNREGYRYRLLSKVEAAEFGKVYISLIASGPRIFRFLPSDHIELIYKEGERMWKWKGLTGSIATLDGEQMHCLESLKEGEIYNRRNSFRVRMGVEHTIIKLIPKPVDSMSEEGMSDEDYEIFEIPCAIKDLSENGIGIYTNDKMDIGTMIEVNLPTTEGLLKMVGNVVRTESGDFGRYREFYGCSFNQVDRKLSKYLFALQREQLKRERGEQ